MQFKLIVFFYIYIFLVLVVPTYGPNQRFMDFVWYEASSSVKVVTFAPPGPARPSQSGHPLTLPLTPTLEIKHWALASADASADSPSVLTDDQT